MERTKLNMVGHLILEATNKGLLQLVKDLRRFQTSLIAGNDISDRLLAKKAGLLAAWNPKVHVPLLVDSVQLPTLPVATGVVHAPKEVVHYQALQETCVDILAHEEIKGLEALETDFLSKIKANLVAEAPEKPKGQPKAKPVTSRKQVRVARKQHAASKPQRKAKAQPRTKLDTRSAHVTSSNPWAALDNLSL